MSKTHTIHSYVVVTKGGSVELADNEGGKFKQFWKMLTPFDEWVDPRDGGRMKHDRSWADKIIENFKAGVRGYIPVPLGHPKTDAELAENNRGELVDLEAREDGLWGKLEIRDNETAEKIENNLIPDVSMGYDDDYQNKKTGEWVGTTLKHVGLVVNPYIKGMTQFGAALSDGAGAAVLFSDSSEANGDNNKEKENTMGKVKNGRDFEVTVKYTEGGEAKEVKVAAGAEVEVPDDQQDAVTKQVTDATAPAAANDGSAELSDAAKKELSDREAELAKREAKLAESEATADYERLLSEGKIVPAQKDAYIALKSKGSATVELSDTESKTVSVLLSDLFEKAPKGKYLSEEGKNDGDGKGGEDEEVELSEEEKSLGDDFGNTPEEIADYKKSLASKS